MLARSGAARTRWACFRSALGGSCGQAWERRHLSGRSRPGSSDFSKPTAHGLSAFRPMGPGWGRWACRQQGGCRQVNNDLFKASHDGRNQAQDSRKAKSRAYDTQAVGTNHFLWREYSHGNAAFAVAPRLLWHLIRGLVIAVVRGTCRTRQPSGISCVTDQKPDPSRAKMGASRRTKKDEG
jgi:hypothetical protein